MPQLILSGDAAAALRKACEVAYPEEACGLLLGRMEGDCRFVVEAMPGTNLDGSAEQFTLDPADFVRADSRARDRGLEIVGVFHSHPDRPARPSRADESAAQPGWSYVVASVDGDGSRGSVSDMRSWALPGDDASPRMIEESVEWAAPVSGPLPGPRSQ